MSSGSGSGGTFRRRTIPTSRPGRKPVPHATCARSGAVDPEHRRAVAHAAAVLSELQDGASALSAVVSSNEVLRAVLTDLANELREQGDIDETRVLHRRDVCLGEGRRRGDRPDQARQGREDHGDRGSPWPAAVGEHACCESSRGHAGPVELRLLHDRSEAGAI